MQRFKLGIRCYFILAVALLIVFSLLNYAWWIMHFATNVTRPIWDKNLIKEHNSFEFVPFFGAKMENRSQMCELHGWKLREKKLKVYDSFLFSSELDLLEIRLNELDPVVDHFIILEANCAFMGVPKPYIFDQKKHLPEFAKFAHKLRYVKVDLAKDCSNILKSFDQERFLRSKLIQEARNAGAKDGDLFLMSDLDEIVRRDVAQLLKECDFGARTHISVDSFRYSFEFRNWPEITVEPHASIIGKVPDSQIFLRNAYLTRQIIGDGGWHCSWCIRSIDSIIFKMKSYSHSDRIEHDLSVLDPKNLQERICKGEDPFGFLPEASSYQDLLSKWSLRSIHGSSHAPIWVQQNPLKFRFLLSGGCRIR
jgi:beta-1,4-mannosyl-glycoprotein beta-1,4-N-acetylglucosaminyltransferase